MQDCQAIKHDVSVLDRQESSQVHSVQHCKASILRAQREARLIVGIVAASTCIRAVSKDELSPVFAFE